MATLEFTTPIEIRGVNPYIIVSSDQAAKLKPNWRKPMPVLTRVNGQPAKAWRINMVPVGNGDFYLYLNGDVRKAASVRVGDIVAIAIDFDETYQNGPQHPIPAAFANALEQRPSAQANWDALPPSRQKELLRYFAGLKSEEALHRNVDRALSVLSGKPGHFMGRDWRDGS